MVDTVMPTLPLKIHWLNVQTTLGATGDDEDNDIT